MVIIPETYTVYVCSMVSDGTYDGHITLHAESNIYNIEIYVVSLIGYAALVKMQSLSISLLLGNFTEGQGKPFVVLNEQFEEILKIYFNK